METPVAAHDHTAPTEHPVHPAEPGSRPHPGAGEYIRIAVILAIITAVETATYALPTSAEGLKVGITILLIVLSAIKFALVVLWYMHLRFDNRLFSQMFFGGLALAGVVLVALLLLYLAAQLGPLAPQAMASVGSGH